MPTPIEIVTDFLVDFSAGNAGMYAAIRTRFTDTTVWENVGLVTTTGIDEACGLCAKFEQTIGIHAIAIDVLAIAADGDKVLTERVDRMLRADGSELAAPKVMGIFEIDGEKIAAWRDYFDTIAAAGHLPA